MTWKPCYVNYLGITNLQCHQFALMNFIIHSYEKREYKFQHDVKMDVQCEILNFKCCTVKLMYFNRSRVFSIILFCVSEYM